MNKNKQREKLIGELPPIQTERPKFAIPNKDDLPSSVPFDKFDDLFLSKEEESQHRLIKLEKSFIKEPKKFLEEMEVEYYNLLDDLKRKKASIISYRDYINAHIPVEKADYNTMSSSINKSYDKMGEKFPDSLNQSSLPQQQINKKFIITLDSEGLFSIHETILNRKMDAINFIEMMVILLNEINIPVPREDEQKTGDSFAKGNTLKSSGNQEFKPLTKEEIINSERYGDLNEVNYELIFEDEQNKVNGLKQDIFTTYVMKGSNYPNFRISMSRKEFEDILAKWFQIENKED